MKTPCRLAALLAVFCFSGGFVQPAAAQLPSLDDKPWLGYFCVYANKDFAFSLSAVGKATLGPMNTKGQPYSDSKAVTILYGIEETMPNGKTRTKQIVSESLESADKPTLELEKTIIRGKVTGDASFEVTMEQSRGVISIGGRITDPGKLTKYPIRFMVRAKIPNMYSSEKKAEKKDLKGFEKKIKDDRVVLKRTDGSRFKETFDKTVDVTTKEVNGPGVSEVEVEIGAYKNRKLLFSASDHSAVQLWNNAPGPLYEGFWIHWAPDTAKDPDGKARFRFTVK